MRPQVVVTYDDNGGYGHPDHIQAHRVAMRAVDTAAGAGHRVAKVYWNRLPRSAAERAFARLQEDLAGLPFAKAAVIDDVPGVVDDTHITAAVDGTAYADAKAAAMRAHATQIEVAPGAPYFALSNDLAQPLLTTEFYELVRGEPGDRDDGRESDLFAGVGEAAS